MSVESLSWHVMSMQREGSRLDDSFNKAGSKLDAVVNDIQFLNLSYGRRDGE